MSVGIMTDDDLDLDQDTIAADPRDLLDMEALPPTPSPQHQAAPTSRASRPLAATPPPAARRPTALRRTDIVPEFRPELHLTRVATGYDIYDPASGQTHLLNEYEVSLARMLNGRRPVFEVLEAGERLGIPTNLESLQKFIIVLEQYGFLRPPETLDAALDNAVGNAWPSRGQWEASVRTLFQSGIRFLRSGKPAEAVSYFEALLQEDPDNIEARELLAMATQQLAAPPTRETPPPPAPAPPVWMPPIQGAQPPAVHAAPAPGGLVVRWRYVLIGMSVVLVAVIAYVVVTRVMHDGNHDAPAIASTAPAKTTRPDPIKPDPIKPDPVKPPIKPDPTKPDPTKTPPVPTKPDPTKPDPTKPDPTKPTPTVTVVAAPISGELRSFLRTRRQVRKGDKLFEIVRVDGDPVKIKQRQADVEEMRALAKQDPDYKAFLADARTELAKIMKVTTRIVKAPKAGMATPKAKAGATVRDGQVLAEIQ